MGAKPLHIWFQNTDELIKIYDEIRYLVLFASERYNSFYGRIHYFISEKNGITLIK